MFRGTFGRFFDALDGSAFVIRIIEGRVELSKGQVSPRFMSDLGEFVVSEGLCSGVIRGQKQSTHVRLEFSPDISVELHQRLRNLWPLH